MKKLVAIFGILSIFFVSCNDEFLELAPTTSLAETEEFWNDESSLETYSNSFYNYIARGDFTEDFNSDIAEHRSNPPSIRRQNYTLPTALGSGGWSWTQLRNINNYIYNVSNSNLDPSIKNRYLAIGKFFRSWFYFKKVEQFGDVPWYSEPLSTDDDDKLFKPRDSRVMVMDSILVDINFAIEHLDEVKYKNRISKYTALALKSRIFLFEGTWRKYHTQLSLPGSEELLREAANAAETLIQSGMYEIFSTGNQEQDYFDLHQSSPAHTDEVILARSSDTQTFYYTPLFTSTSNGNYGATSSFIASFLMTNGQSFQEYYPNAEVRSTMDFHQEFQDRDPRLWQTIVHPGYVRIGTTGVNVTDFNQNSTGYMIHKRVGPPIEDQGGGYRDVIMFRYAEILLNYAEAKAELGEITQDNLDFTINLIRERVGIPPISLPVILDEYQNSLYENTSDPVILEIRRERKIELAFEGFRTNDLRRWKEGHRFRVEYQGIYIPGFREYIDLDNDGDFDIYVFPNNESAPEEQLSGVQYVRLADTHGLTENNSGRIIPFDRPLPSFEDWEYLSPIPTEELTLNPQLDQNPGWSN